MSLSNAYLCAALVVLACSSARADTVFQVSEPSQLEFLGEPKRKEIELNPGKETSVDLSQPGLVTFGQNTWFLLVPVCSGNGRVTLNAPELKEAAQSAAQSETSRVLAKVFPGLANIQTLIRNQRVQEAKTQLETLQNQYPHVKFLEFTRASVLLLQGDRAGARRAVLEGLQAHPEYEEGKALLRTLGGASQ